MTIRLPRILGACPMDYYYLLFLPIIIIIIVTHYYCRLVFARLLRGEDDLVRCERTTRWSTIQYII